MPERASSTSTTPQNDHNVRLIPEHDHAASTTEIKGKRYDNDLNDRTITYDLQQSANKQRPYLRTSMNRQKTERRAVRATRTRKIWVQHRGLFLPEVMLLEMKHSSVAYKNFVRYNF